jgi:hypothetical protein
MTVFAAGSLVNAWLDGKPIKGAGLKLFFLIAKLKGKEK